LGRQLGWKEAERRLRLKEDRLIAPKEFGEEFKRALEEATGRKISETEFEHGLLLGLKVTQGKTVTSRDYVIPGFSMKEIGTGIKSLSERGGTATRKASKHHGELKKLILHELIRRGVDPYIIVSKMGVKMYALENISKNPTHTDSGKEWWKKLSPKAKSDLAKSLSESKIEKWERMTPQERTIAIEKIQRGRPKKR